MLEGLGSPSRQEPEEKVVELIAERAIRGPFTVQDLEEISRTSGLSREMVLALISRVDLVDPAEIRAAFPDGADTQRTRRLRKACEVFENLETYMKLLTKRLSWIAERDRLRRELEALVAEEKRLSAKIRRLRRLLRAREELSAKLRTQGQVLALAAQELSKSNGADPLELVVGLDLLERKLVQGRALRKRFLRNEEKLRAVVGDAEPVDFLRRLRRELGKVEKRKKTLERLLEIVSKIPCKEVSYEEN